MNRAIRIEGRRRQELDLSALAAVLLDHLLAELAYSDSAREGDGSKEAA
jgi:hypothetical protein